MVAVRDRVTRACGDLDELNRRLDEMAERFRGPRGALIDIGVLRDAKDYKAMLGADIDRKRVEIETLGREELERRCEAVEAHRRYEMWKKIGHRIAGDAAIEDSIQPPHGISITP